MPPSSSRGTKRPRKSTQAAVAQQQFASSSSSSSSASTSSARPVDIVKPRPPLIADEDDSPAYSATPPVAGPTKKLSRGNSVASLSSNSAAAPVKSALAASARLASGPPGAMLNDRYKRSMYIAFVDGAFAEREKGSTKSYWDLVSQFRSAHTTLSTSASPSALQPLSLWLHALSHHVSRLDATNHSQLVENILDLPWAGTSDDAFARSWCSFVCALVSARTEWAGSVVTRIVKGMRWRSSWLPVVPLHTAPNLEDTAAAGAPGPSTTTSPPSSPQQPSQPQRPTRRLLYTRLHSLLRAMLILIPTLPSTLSPLLVRHFPHKRESKREQATYAHNVLFMTRYAPQVAESVWRVVGDRAIALDVEIQIELDDLEEGDEAGLEEDLANLDPFDRPLDEEDDESSSDEESDDEEGEDGGDDDADSLDSISENGGDDGDLSSALLHEEQEAETRQRKVRDLVAKLDALLKVAFEHLERVGGVRGKGDANASLEAAVLRPASNSAFLQDFLGTSSSANSTPVSTPTVDKPPRLSRPSSPSTARNSPTHADDDEEDSLLATRHSTFQQLLNLFNRSILPTFKCRHVQFLLFWYCSLEADFSDWFLGVLIQRAIYASTGQLNGNAQDGSGGGTTSSAAPASGVVLRQAAASYVASFVSRATYVDVAYTRAVVLNLCAFLEAHLEEHAAAVRAVQEYGHAGVDEGTARLAAAPPGSEEHAIFYAVAQAVFYIFCFRWQDLRNAGAGVGAAGKDGADKSGSLAPSDDAGLLEHDPGFTIGSLSSAGSSSFALPSSLRGARASPSPSPAMAAGAQSTTTAAADTSSSQSPWSPGLSILQRLIICPLNPLHFCSPTVVHQFASVAQHVGLLYCWSVIEANRRGGAAGAQGERLSGHEVRVSNGQQQQGQRRPAAAQAPPRRGGAAAAGGGGAAQASDLEGFFPFDPYRLRGTAERFVDPLYRHWNDVAPQGLGAGDDDDDDESSGESEDDEDNESSDDDDGPDYEDSLAMSPHDVDGGGLQIPGAREKKATTGQTTAADAKFAKSMELMSVSGS